jgi:pyruvate-ferredoxin/flavodoxin oxidoreductase
VSATKNNIKIIGNSTPWFSQGYFVYDSKKAGGLTVSHLRVSEKPIRSSYLISQADFVGCHQLQFIDKYQMAERLKPGGIFLLNTPYSADEVWSPAAGSPGHAESEKSAFLRGQRGENRPRMQPRRAY